MQSQFCYKYEASGNDFLIISGDSEFASPYWATQLCDRRYGVGADGILVVSQHLPNRVQMIIYNADGTRPEMCGNGVRCVAAYFRDQHQPEFPLQVLSDAGLREVKLGSAPDAYLVSMGLPGVKPGPTRITFQGKEVTLYEANMGNPHAVLFDAEYGTGEKFYQLGRFLNDEHAAFPEGVNLEVVSVTNEGVSVRVYERGVGETLACGTGACAVSVVRRVLQHTDAVRQRILLRGGALDITWDGGPDVLTKEVWMMGTAFGVGRIEMQASWVLDRRTRGLLEGSLEEREDFGGKKRGR